MIELISQLDVIHAEAIKRKEHDDTLHPDNVYLRIKNSEHIANIVKLRQMLTKAISNLSNQTTEDRGDYLEGHEGHEQELINKGLLKR